MKFAYYLRYSAWISSISSSVWSFVKVKLYRNHTGVFNINKKMIKLQTLKLETYNWTKQLSGSPSPSFQHLITLIHIYRTYAQCSALLPPSCQDQASPRNTQHMWAIKHFLTLCNKQASKVTKVSNVMGKEQALLPIRSMEFAN